ncbi:hypothetical protein Tco_1484753 [Tanacetum coccineum]
MQKQKSKVDMGKALDADLVVTESNEIESRKQDTSSRPGNDIDADNADIKPVYDKEPMAETYKDLYDSIKKTRVQTTDHNDSLIAQMNKKSINNADLKAQLQEKVFVIAALKNELRKLKGNISAQYLPKVENLLVKPHHVIASSESRNSSKNMPRFSSNDMVHNYYLEEARKKTQERHRNSKPRRYGVSMPALHKIPQRTKTYTPYPEDLYTPYPRYSNKIFWKILNVVPTPRNSQYAVLTSTNTPLMIDDPNITMEEYIKLQAEKAQRFSSRFPSYRLQ